MPLPPLRHPPWLMVAVIACLGGALASALAHAPAFALGWLAPAVVLAFACGLRLRQWRRTCR